MHENIFIYLFEMIKTKENRLEEKLSKAAFILKAIAHPVRLLIIEKLQKNEEMSVNELCNEANCEQSLMSHHLMGLKLKGLLSSRRKGKTQLYSLKEKSIVKVLECIENCDCNLV